MPKMKAAKRSEKAMVLPILLSDLARAATARIEISTAAMVIIDDAASERAKNSTEIVSFTAH